MFFDDMVCNLCNVFLGIVYFNVDCVVDFYGDNIEVDYCGYEVIVENFICFFIDCVGEEMFWFKCFFIDDCFNILVYMIGYGGNEFFKF